MGEWEFYAADGTQVTAGHAQFKARMVMVSSGIGGGGGSAGDTGHWLYQEVQPIEAPRQTWQCRTLADLKAGIAYYAKHGRWPTKH
jgi:hypothetical protein